MFEAEIEHLLLFLNLFVAFIFRMCCACIREKMGPFSTSLLRWIFARGKGLEGEWGCCGG